MAVIAGFGLATQPRGSGLPATSALPSPQTPLFKPEPSLLLSDPRLKLSAAQWGAIQRIDRAWQRDKARLVQAMSVFTPQRGRADQISAGLADYSELSRSYDSARAHYWAQAAKTLTVAQLREVSE